MAGWRRGVWCAHFGTAHVTSVFVSHKKPCDSLGATRLATDAARLATVLSAACIGNGFCIQRCAPRRTLVDLLRHATPRYRLGTPRDCVSDARLATVSARSASPHTRHGSRQTWHRVTRKTYFARDSSCYTPLQPLRAPSAAALTMPTLPLCSRANPV